ncbi:MAG: Peptide deformylase [Firmicutes bacterium]|nr:Peptide deformylase [Bacillota bacterium]
MAVRLMRERGDEILQNSAKTVTRFDRTLQRLVLDMFETMHHHHGIGLAAPQVGIAKRIIVVEVDEQKLALVNPEIVWASGEGSDVEGCLSWPGNLGEVKRRLSIRVKAQNIHGEVIEVAAEGLLARCLQHEIDHLNGVLFCDIATRMLEKDPSVPPGNE